MKPIVYKLGNDTLFGFTIKQSKFIAMELTRKDYLLKINEKYKSSESICDSVIQEQSNQISLLKEKNENSEDALIYSHNISRIYKEESKKQNKKVKILSILSIALTASLIIK